MSLFQYGILGTERLKRNFLTLILFILLTYYFIYFIILFYKCLGLLEKKN